MSILPKEAIDPLLDLLEACRGVEQMEKHHPEGDVFTHSLQVLHHAMRESEDIDTIVAAMLHDIGKVENSLGHEEIGETWLEEMVSAKTRWLVRQHMRIHAWLNGEMRKLSKVKGLVDHPWFPELVHLARWDKMGRKPNWVPKYDRERLIEKLEKIAQRHFKSPPEGKQLCPTCKGNIYINKIDGMESIK